jgi:hypothetical protein
VPDQKNWNNIQLIYCQNISDRIKFESDKIDTPDSYSYFLEILDSPDNSFPFRTSNEKEHDTTSFLLFICPSYGEWEHNPIAQPSHCHNAALSLKPTTKLCFNIFMFSGTVFMFYASGLVFNGTEAVGSRFHLLRSRTRFRRYGGRQVPF